jgi:hypothetical protein
MAARPRQILDRMVSTGLLKPASRQLLRLTRSAKEALDVLASAEPFDAEKWITPEQR